MNLKYFILSLFINNCSGCENSHNDNKKQEKPIPIKPIKIIHTQDISNIIPDLESYIKGEKSLQDINDEINKLDKIPDNQKKTLNDIKNNLNNKDKLKKIIDNSNKLDSVITGTIQCEKNTEELILFYIDKSNHISKEEILNNIKIFIDKKEINKDKISIYHGTISCKIDNLKKKESLNIRIEINNALMKKITNMRNMFAVTKYTTLNLSKLKTNNVKDMSFMFMNCSSLTLLLDLSTSNVTDMRAMFVFCTSLKEIKGLEQWNTSNVKDMGHMFKDCKSLTSLPDISKWNTNNVTDMSYMFYNCNSLKSLPDISKWNTNNVSDISNMFGGCGLLLKESMDLFKKKWEKNHKKH